MKDNNLSCLERPPECKGNGDTSGINSKHEVGRLCRQHEIEFSLQTLKLTGEHNS